MRRFIGPVWLALLGMSAGPLAAQQSGGGPTAFVEEPRPLPVLPAALVPFTIGPEFCRNGNNPSVSLMVHNVLIQPVATLRMRNATRRPIRALTMRCGSFVAVWDGLISGNGEGGERVAPPGIYYLLLTVAGTDGEVRNVRKVVVPQI